MAPKPVVTMKKMMALGLNWGIFTWLTLFWDWRLWLWLWLWLWSRSRSRLWCRRRRDNLHALEGRELSNNRA